MLIEFKVSNFRSFREEQTFSMAASNYEKELPENLIEPRIRGLSKVRLVKSAAIYGANASGKTNLIEAMRFLALFVRDSATRLQPNAPTGTAPFKLDPSSPKQPSRFEVTVYTEGCLYRFGAALTGERVVEEYLTAWPKGKAQKWYERRFDPKTGEESWTHGSPSFKADDALRERTRPNSLFLSVAAQFNHPQVTPVFEWFTVSTDFAGVRATDLRQQMQFMLSSLEMLADDRFCDKLVTLLRRADMGIADVELGEEEPGGRWLQVMEDRYPYNVHLIHVGPKGVRAAFDLQEEESAGTRRFLALLGPWLQAIKHNRVLVVDEIESSLHPILVKELIRMIHASGKGSVGPQLLFTTHNPVLLDKSLLRRDQVWFTEKDSNGVSHIYPLTDYMPRKDEAMMKGYLAGRYGAIPFIPEGLKP